MKLILILLAFTSSVLVKAQTTNDIWINEFHYDGMTAYGQSDSSEFVELITKTSIANNPTELAKYSLVLYTVGSLGNSLLTIGRGLPYNVASPLYTAAETVYPLSSFTVCPSGTTGFTILNKTMSTLQDIPSGMAIVYNNTVVVQLISYEKSFKISPSSVAGAAAGLTTTLIVKSNGQPAVETALSNRNHAISLTGVGNKYSEFTWDDFALRTATPCAINTGQTLVGGTLPVKIISFNVVKHDKKTRIVWVSANEIDLQNYDVERSSDGISFNAIGKINALGNPDTQSYTFLDDLPMTGKNFYRLKMNGTDHKFSYSETRVIAFENSNNFIINPNPAKHNVSLQFNEILNNATVSIRNNAGQLVKQAAVSGSNKINLNVSNLAAGIYVIEVSSKGYRKIERMVISR